MQKYKELHILKEWGKEFDIAEINDKSEDELAKLKSLDIHGTINTFIPKEIGVLKNLKHLTISFGDIDTLPSEIGDLSNLVSLELKHLKIKTLPASIGKLTKLKKLGIEYTPIETIPESIANLHNLIHLEISISELRELPLSICKLPKLRVLDLTRHTILNFPPEIGDLKELRILITTTLNASGIADTAHNPFPKEIMKLKNLKMLCCDLREIPEAVCHMQSLKVFGYGMHQLKSLPKSIDKLLSKGFIEMSNIKDHKILKTIPNKEALLKGFKIVDRYRDEQQKAGYAERTIYRYNRVPIIKQISTEEFLNKKNLRNDIISQIAQRAVKQMKENMGT